MRQNEHHKSLEVLRVGPVFISQDLFQSLETESFWLRMDEWTKEMLGSQMFVFWAVPLIYYCADISEKNYVFQKKPNTKSLKNFYPNSSQHNLLSWKPDVVGGKHATVAGCKLSDEFT